MRLLFVIPHFYSSSAGDEAGSHGSGDLTGRDRRARVVAQTIWSLHQTFGPQQSMLRISDQTIIPANQSLSHSLHVVVLTNDRDHLVSESGAGRHVEHSVVDGDPRMLGFAAHDVMRNRTDDFDFVAYLEDDLWIRDALFFQKLSWFNENTDQQSLLLPNRFEHGYFHGDDSDSMMKCFVDGDLAPRVTGGFQDVDNQPEYMGKVMGKTVRWTRALNPHSGCFFLSQSQARHWASRPEFGNRDTSFIGPLESAATLSVARAFRVYKPAPENASFLELEHGDRRFIHSLKR